MPIIVLALISLNTAIVNNNELNLLNVEALTDDEPGESWEKGREIGSITVTEKHEKQMYGPTGMPMWYTVEVDVDIECCVKSNQYNMCNSSGLDDRCNNA